MVCEVCSVVERDEFVSLGFDVVVVFGVECWLVFGFFDEGIDFVFEL